MKIVIGGLSGLGTASLVIGAALWFQSWTIAEWSGETRGFLLEIQNGHEADLAQGLNRGTEFVLPMAIFHLEGASRNRCSEFNAYSKALGGFALTFSTLAVIVWRRQKLPDVERQTSELAVPSCRDVRGRQTKNEAASAGVLETSKKEPVSTR